MTIITGKHLSRRTLLRGVGAAVALPLLDAMSPSLARAATRPGRVGVVYVPNGIVMNDWKLKEVGADFTFTRILKPLEPFRAATLWSCRGCRTTPRPRRKGAGTPRRRAAFFRRLSPSTRPGRMCARASLSTRSRRGSGRPRRACPRSSLAARTRAWSATATPDRVALIPTRFPGGTPTSRWRSRSIRARCSSGCLERSIRVSIRLRGRGVRCTARASSIRRSTARRAW